MLLQMLMDNANANTKIARLVKSLPMAVSVEPVKYYAKGKRIVPLPKLMDGLFGARP